VPQGRDDQVEKASGRAYGCGRACPTALKRCVGFGDDHLPDRLFLDFLHFFREAFLPDIPCDLVEKVS